MATMTKLASQDVMAKICRALIQSRPAAGHISDHHETISKYLPNFYWTLPNTALPFPARAATPFFT